MAELAVAGPSSMRSSVPDEPLGCVSPARNASPGKDQAGNTLQIVYIALDLQGFQPARRFLREVLNFGPPMGSNIV